MGYFFKAVKNITDDGVKVYMNSLQPAGDYISPKHMYNLNGLA